MNILSNIAEALDQSKIRFKIPGADCRDGQLDGRQFVIDQAKHQSGNLVGWGVGALIICVGGTAAPVLILSLIAGAAVQALWNYSGAADWSGRQAENLIGTD